MLYALLTVIVFNVHSDGYRVVHFNLRYRTSQEEREKLSVFKNIVIDNWNLVSRAAGQWSCSNIIGH